jgi:ubiquinone/menaquinone biosynthesis C-methylase UbiE
MTIACQPQSLSGTPFDAIAGKYDAQFTDSLIGRAQRRAVWRETDRHFLPGSRVLEINCGTGEDALHLASRAVFVLACDASIEMIKVAQQRASASPHRNFLAFRMLPTEMISQLDGEGRPYDGVLSNFAGLNCVTDMEIVARDLARLVRPGGTAVLCFFGRLCLGELLWFGSRGELRKAGRRFRRQAQLANVGSGKSVWVHYPSVWAIRRAFAPHFRLIEHRGIGVAVPPSYVEPWAEQHTQLLEFAVKLDKFFGRTPCLRALADHALLIFERRTE